MDGNHIVKKPPLGVMPRKIWLERRIDELQRALVARFDYMKKESDFRPDSVDTVSEWMHELQTRIGELMGVSTYESEAKDGTS